MRLKNTRWVSRLSLTVVLAYVVLASSLPALAQSGCGSSGFRVVARRWDAVLKMGWELRQDCMHPEWPARSVATAALASEGVIKPIVEMRDSALIVQPLLVRAGDTVRLWQQNETVRIEMSGVAEQSARNGERVVVRVMRQSAEEGQTVDRIAGTVRGAADVEMER
jgi:hypothetical protein